MEIQFSRQIFEKCSNIKFHENPSSVSRVVPCGRTDRHDEASSPFSQLCERDLKVFSRSLVAECFSFIADLLKAAVTRSPERCVISMQ